MSKLITASEAERDRAQAYLRKLFVRARSRQKLTIITVEKWRGLNGMLRALDCYTIRNGEMIRLTWSIAAALGYKYHKGHEGVLVKGAGMDMHFHLVSVLSAHLFRNTRRTKKGSQCIAGEYHIVDEPVQAYQVLYNHRLGH